MAKYIVTENMSRISIRIGKHDVNEIMSDCFWTSTVNAQMKVSSRVALEHLFFFRVSVPVK
jgi:hypothetical protein